MRWLAVAWLVWAAFAWQDAGHVLAKRIPMQAVWVE